YQRYFNKDTSSLAASKIPQVLHFIWGGENPFPQESVKNIASWMKYHPSWTVKFWTDDPNRPIPIAGVEQHLISEVNMERIGPYFQTATNWGEKSDLLRYEILYQEGGI